MILRMVVLLVIFCHNRESNLRYVPTQRIGQTWPHITGGHIGLPNSLTDPQMTPKQLKRKILGGMVRFVFEISYDNLHY